MGSYSLTARCGVHSILLKAVSLSWHRLAAVRPSWPDILQRRSLLQGETALYRHIVFLCSIVVTLLSTASAARADDSERCQELGHRLEITKSQITAIEGSLPLLSPSYGNFLPLPTELLDHDASVDARDRFGPRPLSHA